MEQTSCGWGKEYGGLRLGQARWLKERELKLKRSVSPIDIRSEFHRRSEAGQTVPQPARATQTSSIAQMPDSNIRNSLHLSS